MKDVLLLAVRVIAGGALVVAFAMLSDTLKPKTFAGLFSAAPSVATASLLVSGLATGPAKDQEYASGMIAGAIGLVFYSLAAAFLVKQLGAIAMIAFAIVVSLAATRWGVMPGLVAALAVWLVVAVGLYGLVATLYGREPSAP